MSIINWGLMFSHGCANLRTRGNRKILLSSNEKIRPARLRYSIELLTPTLMQICKTQFSTIGWQKPKGYFHKCYLEQQAGEITFFVAHQNSSYVGHVKLVWTSSYFHFAKTQIPEIQDLNVLPEFRKRGVGTSLIAKCEAHASRRSSSIGICVGLHPGYNEAQRLYSQLGYQLDGKGVNYKNKPVEEGNVYLFDDDLVIYFTKRISSGH